MGFCSPNSYQRRSWLSCIRDTVPSVFVTADAVDPVLSLPTERHMKAWGWDFLGLIRHYAKWDLNIFLTITSTQLGHISRYSFDIFV